jgi:hypothetical protein
MNSLIKRIGGYMSRGHIGGRRNGEYPEKVHYEVEVDFRAFCPRDLYECLRATQFVVMEHSQNIEFASPHGNRFTIGCSCDENNAKSSLADEFDWLILETAVASLLSRRIFDGKQSTHNS